MRVETWVLEEQNTIFMDSRQRPASRWSSVHAHKNLPQRTPMPQYVLPVAHVHHLRGIYGVCNHCNQCK